MTMSTNRPGLLEPDLLPFGMKCSCLGLNLDRLIQPSILTLLVHHDLHGYVIIQELNQREFPNAEKIDSAGIYRTLKKMEEQGLLSSEWDIHDFGATKRIYKITPSGKACLEKWVQTLTDYRSMIETIIEIAKSELTQG
jgi:poly-beta-hydroxybutyrate-responsive repressor